MIVIDERSGAELEVFVDIEPFQGFNSIYYDEKGRLRVAGAITGSGIKKINEAFRLKKLQKEKKIKND